MLRDSRIDFAVLFQVGTGGAPAQADAPPTFRVYGDSGLLVGSGAMTQALSGTITGVTNANPAAITSVAHGLTDGTIVTVAGVGGATGVNGGREATRVDADTFTVPVAAGGAYTSGGSWKVTGLYVAEFDSSLRAALEPGRSYVVFADYKVSAAQKVDEVERFTAV